MSDKFIIILKEDNEDNEYIEMQEWGIKNEIVTRLIPETGKEIKDFELDSRFQFLTDRKWMLLIVCLYNISKEYRDNYTKRLLDKLRSEGMENVRFFVHFGNTELFDFTTDTIQSKIHLKRSGALHYPMYTLLLVGGREASVFRGVKRSMRFKT